MSNRFVYFMRLHPSEFAKTPEFNDYYNFLSMQKIDLELYRDKSMIELIPFLLPLLDAQRLHPDLYTSYRDEDYNLDDCTPESIIRQIVKDFTDGKTIPTPHLYPSNIFTYREFLRMHLANTFGLNIDALSPSFIATITRKVLYLLHSANLITFNVPTQTKGHEKTQDIENLLDDGFLRYTLTNLGIATLKRYQSELTLDNFFQNFL